MMSLLNAAAASVCKWGDRLFVAVVYDPSQLLPGVLSSCRPVH